jgi:hypothetical protein
MEYDSDWVQHLLILELRRTSQLVVAVLSCENYGRRPKLALKNDQE